MFGRPKDGSDQVDRKALRRLAAVAFVDVVGYTTLMATDEAQTHLRWMRILSGLIHPKATDRRGVLVKSTGDGVLVEFGSSLDAVEWAVEVQEAVALIQVDDDAGPPTIALRIAVHLGDVFTTAFDVFGDGVNVAARLQEHAKPGGIVLSEAVYDLVRSNVRSPPRELGLVHLRGLERPVRLYALDPKRPLIAFPVLPRQEMLPSIAVLPLQNLSTDSGDDYFGEGIVEDIIVSLAALRELFVISRASTLAYRGQRLDPRDVGRDLGVRYVLMGTVRRSATLIRVSAQLCEAHTGAAIWGDTVEVSTGELFDVQDLIVTKIVSGIAPNVRAAELRTAMRKKPGRFTPYDHTLRALHLINDLNVEHFSEAREWLSTAMTEDPNFAMAFAWAARWHSLYVGQGWSANPWEDANRAISLAARAIELDGQNALALATYGHLKSYLFHDCELGMIYFDRALSACPNHSLAWVLSSASLSYLGRTKQAIMHAERALRLSPFDRDLSYYYMIMCLAYFADGSYEDAVKWGRMSVNENPRYSANHRFLAAALSAAGRTDESYRTAASLMRLEPDFRLGTYEHTRQPFQNSEIAFKYMKYLRQCGLLE
jgi:adenylate cyclase